MWDELFATHAALTDADRNPQWAGGQQVDTHVDADGVEHPVFHVRYRIYSPRVSQWRELSGELGSVSPFDWPTWPGSTPTRAARGS